MASSAVAAEHAVTSALATGLPHSVGPESAQAKPARTPLRFRHANLVDASDDSSDSDRDATDSEGETTAVDDGTYQDDNFVRKVLAKEKPLPPITLATLHKNINVISTLALTVVPALAIYGALSTPVQLKTAIWAVVYYFYTGLGITAGALLPGPLSLWQNRSLTLVPLPSLTGYHRLFVCSPFRSGRRARESEPCRSLISDFCSDN